MRLQVPLPLQERVYTIMVFIIGATFYSILYGNIGQVVSNLYQSGLRCELPVPASVCTALSSCTA